MSRKKRDAPPTYPPVNAEQQRKLEDWTFRKLGEIDDALFWRWAAKEDAMTKEDYRAWGRETRASHRRRKLYRRERGPGRKKGEPRSHEHSEEYKHHLKIASRYLDCVYK